MEKAPDRSEAFCLLDSNADQNADQEESDVQEDDFCEVKRKHLI